MPAERAARRDPALLALHDAILPEVVFDGWSATAFAAAAQSAGLTRDEARALAPHGAVDLAALSHELADEAMLEAMARADLSALRYSEKVAHALRLRIDVITDREAVRRALSLFSLPQHAPQGARLVWGTADAVWRALGDTSRDANWYSKRATLSAVWASVVVYWLGDDSPDHEKTSAFIDRRIENVMQVEKAKAQMRKNPLLRPVIGPLEALLSRVPAPAESPRDDLPGARP